MSGDAEQTKTARSLFDFQANRAAQKYSTGEQLRRVLWSFGQWAIRLSPRPLFAWRAAVLRAFGAKVGRHVHVYPTTRIYMPWNVEIDEWAAIGEEVLIYSLGKVRIGARVAIAHRSHLCAGTHDFDEPTLRLLKPPIAILEDAWIGTDAFIGPGVVVGHGAIVGARAVVVKDVPAMHVVAGNPARLLRIRTAVATSPDHE